MRVFLQTPRLILREFEPADVDRLVSLDSDPAVMRYLTGGKPTPRATIERNLYTPGRWAAVTHEGSFLGWFSLRPAAVDEAELGYRLVSRCWGQGYATEGAQTLVHKGLADGLRRIFAQTMAVNLASRRVMEKAGLRYVRTFHLDWDDPIEGFELGEVEYEVLSRS